MIKFDKIKITPKKWGAEWEIDNNDKYCGKILIFNKGASFSTHMHRLKTETWYLLEGQLSIKYYDLSNADTFEKILNPGDVIKIPSGEPHKLTAILPSRVIEVSTTHYDSDSYRIEKGDSQK